MSLTSKDFTSNDDINLMSNDESYRNDGVQDIVGYVIKTYNNLQSSKTSKFFKIIVSNGTGKEVQVIGWNDFMKTIQPLKLYDIVHIGNVKVNIVKNSSFNHGNTNFELLIKDNSTVETFGSYQVASETIVIEDVSIQEAYSMINKTVRIDGVLCTEPRIHRNFDYEVTVGSITDCHNKLEVKFECDVSSKNLLMGAMVQVKGQILNLSSGPPFLKIVDVDDIKVVDKERISFLEVMKGYHTS